MPGIPLLEPSFFIFFFVGERIYLLPLGSRCPFLTAGLIEGVPHSYQTGAPLRSDIDFLSSFFSSEHVLWLPFFFSILYLLPPLFLLLFYFCSLQFKNGVFYFVCMCELLAAYEEYNALFSCQHRYVSRCRSTANRDPDIAEREAKLSVLMLVLIACIYLMCFCTLLVDWRKKYCIIGD